MKKSQSQMNSKKYIPLDTSLWLYHEVIMVILHTLQRNKRENPSRAKKYETKALEKFSKQTKGAIHL